MFEYGGLRGKPVILQLLVLLLLFVAALTLSAFFASSILQILGFNTLTDPNALYEYDKPGVLQAVIFMQVFASFGGFLLPPLAFSYLIGQRPFSFLKLNRKTGVFAMLLAAMLIVSLMPMVNFLGEINGNMDLPDWIAGSFDINFLGKSYHFEGIEQWMRNSEDQLAELTDAFLQMPTVGSLLFNLFMLALLPAIGEELIFRGAIQQLIAKRANVHIAVWLTAIIFSAIHMQFYGFLPRMFLGAMLGYLFVWSGNLWYPIIGHFANNAGAVLLTYFIQKGAISEEIETVGAENNIWLYAISSIVVGGLLAFFFYRSAKATSSTPFLQNS